MIYSDRQKKLAEALRCARVDALLVTYLPNIMYLCGFTGSSGALLVPAERGRSWLFTDGRYTQQAADEVHAAGVVIGQRPALIEACKRVQRARIKALGFESEHLPFASARLLSQELRSKVRLKPLAGLVEQLRLIKDADELQRIRASARLAAGLLDRALQQIRPGISEATIAGEMEFQARGLGAEKMSFDTIVAAGPRSALPHGRASSHPIPAAGFIILDWGVILAGYCSDMTRTVHVGPVSATHRSMYQAVREAQSASIEAVRPGAEVGEVDHAGREVLKKAGYASYFTHSTGHGVGIEIHEAPRLAKGQRQKLAPGMVVTIEPGIYIPDEGGVRIEDMVLVTESGHEVLTSIPKDLITL
ncbi:MAG TPA: Xaa-Pro peptidase family protein [Candidatus Angelobacter sp.]|nr:Xaa-Pro peptidase family protein [Candidatus Angelobacter sp.]